MNHETDNSEWPREAGARELLSPEMTPPAELEDRVVAALLRRGLITADGQAVRRRPGWRIVRASLAAAACFALVAVGVLIGRVSGTAGGPPQAALSGAETDLYALLLYETSGYDRPSGAEALNRYGEYNVWIADARKRGQFVTGEDLDVEEGWLLSPSADGIDIGPSASVAGDAPLSGILFIRATGIEHAIELARKLPHIRHGGSVLVQKTIPTDVPPKDADAAQREPSQPQ